MLQVLNSAEFSYSTALIRLAELRCANRSHAQVPAYSGDGCDLRYGRCEVNDPRAPAMGSLINLDCQLSVGWVLVLCGGYPSLWMIMLSTCPLGWLLWCCCERDSTTRSNFGVFWCSRCSLATNVQLGQSNVHPRRRILRATARPSRAPSKWAYKEQA